MAQDPSIPARLAEASWVRGAYVENRPDSSRVTVEVDRIQGFRSGRATDRIYVDLEHTTAYRRAALREILPEKSGLIRRVRVAQNRPGTSRVVLELSGEADFKVSQEAHPSRLVIDVFPGSRRSAASTEASIAESDASGPPASFQASLPPSQVGQSLVPSVVSGPAGESSAVGASSTPAPSAAVQPVKPVTTESDSSSLAPSGQSLPVPRVQPPPRIEDFLHAAPPGYARVTDFRQRVPHDGRPVTEETSTYLGYDDGNLYVAFVCKDDPRQIRAHLSKREQVKGEDVVAVYLDTFQDNRRAYSFTSNALGVQQDAIKYEGTREEDTNFDTLWWSDGMLTDDGFIVLMTIPFKSLRFSSAHTQKWGIALRRQIVRSSEDAYWPYITDRIQGFVPQFALAYGLEGISPGRNVQLIPYVAAAGARLLNTGQNPGFQTDRDFRAGLDAKVVVKDAFTIDATINPDFSQVESDDPQVTINRRFEVFFPEKRPFFTENASYFETPINLFFSRRIVDPSAGVRVTGRTGKWAIGGLAAEDRAPLLQRGSRTTPLDSHARIGVFRAQRDLGSSSWLGALATTHNWGGGSNHVVSADSRIRLSPNWFFTGQAAQSRTYRDDKPASTGHAFDASLNRVGRHFTYVAGYNDLSPDFQTDLGFIERTDIRTASQFASYRWWPEKGALQSFGPAFTALVRHDYSGRLQDWFLQADFDFQFSGPNILTVSRSEAYELFQRGFRQERSSISFFNGSKRWIQVFAQYGFGSAINYNPASGIHPFLADSRDASFTLSFRPSTRLHVDQTYIYSWLGRPEDLVIASTGESGAVFSNHLFRSRVNYQFTKRLSLRAILDYFSALPNSRLIASTDFKRLSGDILLTYLVNPGTALHIGYTSRYDNVALDPLDGRRVVPIRSPSTPTARQIFIKLNHLIRF